MKKNLNKKLILIPILIFIILFIKIFFLKELSKPQIIDDILFLKLLSNGNLNKNLNNNTENKEENQQYNFKISYKNIDFKTIDLSKTINNKTLIYEKIAPGTQGSFDILLDSNQNLKYKVDFYSKNQKPKNLKFKASKNENILGEADTLEELSKSLTGYITKNEKINIKIDWYWNYENNKNKEYEDIQDTKDSGNIRTYQFDIYTLGEEKS